MMNRLDFQSRVAALEQFRDEETEIEPLGTPVALGVTAGTLRGGGQTRVTFVESESTDDE